MPCKTAPSNKNVSRCCCCCRWRWCCYSCCFCSEFFHSILCYFMYFLWNLESFWRLRRPGGTPGLPEESPRSPWRSVGRFCINVGVHFGTTLALFWLLLGAILAVVFYMIFWWRFDSKMVPFWIHFGVIFGAKKYKKSGRFAEAVSRSILALPGHPPRSKIIENAGRVD